VRSTPRRSRGDGAPRVASCSAARRRFLRSRRLRLSRPRLCKHQHTRLRCRWAICSIWPTIPATLAPKRPAVFCCTVSPRRANQGDVHAAGIAAPWLLLTIVGIHAVALLATLVLLSARFAVSGASCEDIARRAGPCLTGRPLHRAISLQAVS